MARGRKPITFEEFVDTVLIKNYCCGKGKPKHTRFVKKLFYRFSNELKELYGFNIHKCSCCGIEEWQGRAIIMELDHINRVTNDSRIENLRPLCPNCHSQTDGFRNRSIDVCQYVQTLKKVASNA